MPAVEKCSRCLMPLPEAAHTMAGKVFCCASCSVGSACEHQGVSRRANVRRYDGGFAGFRESARKSSPYEPNTPGR